VKPADWREGVVTSPHGITFDNDGNILETEWNQFGRVLRWNRK
jgi:YD repeat-containing protein